MASKYWLKLYHEILDDRKVAKLSTHLRWRMVECFLLAGVENKDGRLPAIEDAAFLARTDEKQLIEDWADLIKAGILEFDDDDPDYYVVKNFAKRQAPVSTNERVARFRERKRKKEYYVTEELRSGNEDVTNRYTDTDKIRKEPDQNGAGAVFTLYEQEIGLLTPGIADKIGGFVDDYPDEWVSEAIMIASENNARNCKYIGAILTRWQKEGKDNHKGSKKNAANLEDELKRMGYGKQ
jgi:DnaD/phage-associated family protein